MRTIKILKIISVTALAVPLFLGACSLVANLLLYPSGLCHPFNGSDFGSSPLCFVPQVSYFVGIAFSLVGFVAPLGVITLIMYFMRVYFYNKQHDENIKYSRLMVSLVGLIALFVLIALLFSEGANKRIQAREDLKFQTPTVDHFVCNATVAVTVYEYSDPGHYYAMVYRDGNNGLQIDFDTNNKTVVPRNYGHKWEDYDYELKNCLNVNRESVHEAYSLQEYKEVVRD